MEDLRTAIGVCKLWLGVGRGMLPVKHLPLKILNGVNYCGRQLAQGFEWTARAYLKKEGQPLILQHARCKEEFALLGADWDVKYR